MSENAEKKVCSCQSRYFSTAQHSARKLNKNNVIKSVDMINKFVNFVRFKFNLPSHISLSAPFFSLFLLRVKIYKQLNLSFENKFSTNFSYTRVKKEYK